MNPNQPYRFSKAEKLILLASAFAGVGVPLLVIRPESPLVAVPPLLAALASAAGGLAIHLAERRRARRRPAAQRRATSGTAAPGPDWCSVAPV